MAEYIDKEKLLKEIDEDYYPQNWTNSEAEIQADNDYALYRNVIEAHPIADVVEVKKVAEMLNDLFGDNCPCNYNDIDEWLPYCCEYANTCDCPCEDGWVQFIKHYDKRKEGAE